MNTRFKYTTRDLLVDNSKSIKKTDYNNFVGSGSNFLHETFRVGNYELMNAVPIATALGAIAGRYFGKGKKISTWEGKGAIVGVLAGTLIGLLYQSYKTSAKLFGNILKKDDDKEFIVESREMYVDNADIEENEYDFVNDII